MITEFLNDLGIDFKHRFSVQIAGFGCKPTFSIHGRHHLEAISHSDFIVLLTMSRCDVNAAGPLVPGDKLTKNNL